MNPLAKLRSWLHGITTAAPPSQANASSMAPLFRVIAPEARDRWQGAALRAYTPQYVEQITRGAMAGNLQAQWEMFDLMEQTWPRLNSALNDLKDAVLGLQWNLQPWSPKGAMPSPEAQRRARLCEELLWNFEPRAEHDENDFEDTLRDILDSVGKGIAVLEIDWHVRFAEAGVLLAPRCTRWVHPRFYGYPTSGPDHLMLDGTQLALNQSNVSYGPVESRSELRIERSAVLQLSTQAPLNSQLNTVQGRFLPFPQNKFLIAFCKQKSGHPISGALLRIMGFWWAASNFTWEWFLRYAQIFGMPFRMAFYDANASQVTIDKIQEMLEGMGSAAWAAFPAGTQFEIKTDLQHASRSAHQALLDAADKLVDILIKRQTLTTDAGDRGTQALGVVHQGVRADRIMAVAGHAARIINRQLLPAICRLNFGDTRECPWIQPGEKEARDEKAMAERDRILLEAGLPMPRNWFYERHAIPQPSEGEDVIVAGSSVPSSGFRVPSSTFAAREYARPTVQSSLRFAHSRAVAPESDPARSSAVCPTPATRNSEPGTRNGNHATRNSKRAPRSTRS